MKFIIFISSVIQHGEYPRLPDFPYSEALGKYIYQGRELTLEEFNAAAEIVFNPHYRRDKYSFQPQVIDSKTVIKLEESRAAKAAAELALHEAKLASEAERLTKVEADSPPTPEADPEAAPLEFRLDGKGIFLGEERVAGLYGEEKQLRVFKDELRPEIEEWLQTLTPTEQ